MGIDSSAAPLALPLTDEHATKPLGGASPARSPGATLLRASMPLALLALSAWVFRDVALAPLWSEMLAARPGWILLGAAVNLLVVALHAACWLALVRPLSPAATLQRCFRALVVGFAFSTVLPARAGELLKLRSLSRSTGLPGPSVLATILLDYLVSAAGLLLGLLVLPCFIEAPIWMGPGAAGVITLFAVGVAFVLVVRPESKGPGRRIPTSAPGGRISRARQGLLAAGQPKALGLALIASLSAWLLELAVVELGMNAVGLKLPISSAILVLLAVNLAAAIPFAPPGNLGTLEAGAAVALISVGVDRDQALAFGLVYHSLQLVPVGLLGLAFSTRGFDSAWA